MGLLRREITDRFIRALASPPIPPRELLANVQMTPWAREYLDVGQRSASAIQAALESAGLPADRPTRVLDFGCGSGRTLRHLAATGWSLTGTDIDAEAIRWCHDAMPGSRFFLNDTLPPLPFDARSFDVVYSISVFTHLDLESQRAWRDEINRVLSPGGLLAISTMGPSILGNFPAIATESRVAMLQRDGGFFAPGTGGFNSNAAFHTVSGIVAMFAGRFDLLRWNEQGLDGFQDLTVLRLRD